MLVNYHKRKNAELFKSLDSSDSLFLSTAQNYIPIYQRFFSLNETNFNHVNLNHKWHISNVNSSDRENSHMFNCRLKNVITGKTKDRNVFVKTAPLLDPYKYLIGKYDVTDEKLFKLPQINSTNLDCNEKVLDPNNTAYIDGFFVFLTSNLMHNHNFLHGVDYYGSFLGIKNNFTLNVFDDIEYLNKSEFFNKNKNNLFKIDEYNYLFQSDTPKLKPITIDHNISVCSQMSIASFDNNIFEGVFEENTVSLNDLKDAAVDLHGLVDLTNINLLENNDAKHLTLKSNSTCSSRSSYTDDGSHQDKNNQHVTGSKQNKGAGGINENNKNKGENEDENKGENEDENKDENKDENEDENEDEDSEWEDDDSNSGSESYEDPQICATINKFPVQIICMENCEDTFDNLILDNELTHQEWYSALMQIIMMLITYQKAFGLTHNDLHSNNVMYNHTDKKFIYYCYKKKHYKVPTFGRMFKIIDFGRSIYKYDGKLFCSDSFQMGGDAATQYNIEPYFNEKKPRLDPNFSFDLCRLACSIFDYVIDDIDDIRTIKKCKDPIKRLICDWCLDDRGVNMLYKNDGTDRYPEFKLYKMIARCVHKHTPQAQLERPEFDAFSNFKGEVPSDVIDLDSIPSYM